MLEQWGPTIVAAVLLPLFTWIIRATFLDAIKELRASNGRLGQRLGELEKWRAVMEDRDIYRRSRGIPEKIE